MLAAMFSTLSRTISPGYRNGRLPTSRPSAGVPDP